MGRKSIRVSAYFVLIMFAAFLTANANTVIVPGTSDLWLAGMTDGSTASDGDTAPGQSPVQFTGLVLSPGSLLSFITTGLTDHCSDGICGLAGPDGDAIEGNRSHNAGSQNGISSLTAPIDSLIGVFLGPNQPNLAIAPNALDFSSGLSRDFAQLNPELQQAFFIGDGLSSGSNVQKFAVPTGATRLFLGTMDSYGWFNNVGELSVTIANPEPTSLLLLGTGLGGLALAAWRRRK
jgi:hypothetical protein